MCTYQLNLVQAYNVTFITTVQWINAGTERKVLSFCGQIKRNVAIKVSKQYS